MNCLSFCLFVFAKGQAKRFGGMDCMEYVESTSSFVISEDSESLLFVESLNLEVLIHEFGVIGVRKVMDFSAFKRLSRETARWCAPCDH